MSIFVTDRDGLMTSEMKQLAERRLLFALSRFDVRISRIDLVVGDENGPRGGVDKSCRLSVRVSRAADVVITDKDADLAKCISRVAERAARAVARSIERSRQFQPRREPTPGVP